jgi:hypothetical protein
MKRGIRVGIVLLASIVAAGGGVFFWLRYAPRRTPEGQPPLTVVEGSVAELKEAFNAAAGEDRVLLFLSPT